MSLSHPVDRETMREALAIPYILTAYSAIADDGRWRRYAEYHEIGRVCDGDTPLEAMDRLEAERVDYILSQLAHGEEVVEPRAYLRTSTRLYSDEELDALVDEVHARQAGSASGGA